MKRKTIIRIFVALASLVAFAIVLHAFEVRGLVRARHAFRDGSQTLTVVVCERPNDSSPVNLLAWLGILQVGRYTYWLELRRDDYTIATTGKLGGDTYRAKTVRVLSVDTNGAVVDLGNENGEATFVWKYK